MFDAAFFDQFFKGPLRQYTFDDKPYGLADMAQDFGVFANDRIMKKVGLTVPNTWDELIADAPKFSRGLYPARLGQSGAQHLPGLLSATRRPVRRRRLCA